MERLHTTYTPECEPSPRAMGLLSCQRGTSAPSANRAGVQLLLTPHARHRSRWAIHSIIPSNQARTSLSRPMPPKDRSLSNKLPTMAPRPRTTRTADPTQIGSLSRPPPATTGPSKPFTGPWPPPAAQESLLLHLVIITSPSPLCNPPPPANLRRSQAHPLGLVVALASHPLARPAPFPHQHDSQNLYICHCYSFR
jgi:hypothetical protein